MEITDENSIKITSVKEYLNIILSDNLKDDNFNYYYRGESKIHKYILPSLYVDKKLSLSSSEYYYRSLFSQLGREDYNNGADLFRLMSEFQHYGAKTRILDITSNPLAALYFAVEKFYGESIPDSAIEGKELCYPKEEGIIYIFRSHPKDEKFDTGHSIAIKTALNLMPIEMINRFISTCSSVKKALKEDWYSFQYYTDDSIGNYILKLKDKEGEDYIKSQFGINGPAYYICIRQFLTLLNQRARTLEELKYPFKIFEDLSKSHVVIPSKCTDRIKQQQGYFIFPKYVNTECDSEKAKSRTHKEYKTINEIQQEIDDSISALSKDLRIRAIIIPPEYKISIRKELNILGVTQGYIYPDIEHRSNDLLEKIYVN